MSGQYVTLLDANGQPVTMSSNNSTTVVAFPAVQPVSATALPLPANAAQETGGHLASVDAKLTTTAIGLKVDGSAATQPVSGSVTVSNFPASQPVSGSVAVTNLPATQSVSQGAAGVAAWKVDGSAVTQPVSGTVAVSNFPGTQPVSGTVAVANFPATQPVSGTLAVSNFPASQAVAVSNFPATQAVTGSLSVSNFPGTQPVSGAVSVTNLPATQTVAGTVGVSNFPATQAVSGTLSVANFPVDTAGSLTVNFEGRKQSYRCAVVGGTPVASATAPTFSISGSASKVIRVTKIGLSVSAATGAACDAIVRRFSALTGGTSASQAANIAKLDTGNAAATALVSAWSAAATTATSAGILASQRYEIVTAAVSTQPGAIFWLFGDNNSSALVLRGASDSVGVCLSAVGATPIYDVWVEFTEE